MITESMVNINLLKDDVMFIESQGKKRNSNGKNMGWRNYAPTDSDLYHTIGYAGEWACSLLYNLPIGAVTSSSAKYLKSVGDIGGSIEVTTTTKSGENYRNLVRSQSRAKRESVYVLCWGDLWPRNIVIVGWTYGSDLIENGLRTKAGHNDDVLYRLSYKTLRKPLDLFDVIRGVK